LTADYASISEKFPINAEFQGRGRVTWENERRCQDLLFDSPEEETSFTCVR